MTTTFAVTAIGTDRPGIVAAVTSVLVDVGCNLEDTAMTILRGEFAMVMVVAPPDGLGAAELEGALAARTASFGMVVNVRPLPPGRVDGPAPGDTTWTVVVHGADRPGIVHGMAAAIASFDGNITDLKTQMSGELYVMVIEVDVPAAVGGDAVQSALAAAAGDLGVTYSAHPSDTDIL